MQDDPLLQLICDALGVMNAAFIDFHEPRSVEMEFYHQFRKYWDRGIPVGMGLGHLITKTHPGMDLAIYRHGDHGKPEEPLAALWFGAPREPFHDFPRTIAILFGPEPPLPRGVERIDFDTKRWTARVSRT